MKHDFNKSNNLIYYNRLKREFLPLIPEGPNVILDLGCGTGRLGYQLREMNKVSELVGVEVFPPAAQEAEECYNKVYCIDVESLTLPYAEYFDYVICGDVLEHLCDPWAMLLKINKMLKGDGSLICSIPNIRHYKIIMDLLLKGRWEYSETGIMDASHLRFFTKSSFLKALADANFRVTWMHMVIHGKKKLANQITFGIFSEFLSTQIMFSAVKIQQI
jgi:2-polyprenyl-3-methyl-5-hydroxy-6-metoxy-1,4-benzoquinol methylase